MKKILLLSTVLLMSIPTLQAEETTYQSAKHMQKVNFGQKIFRKKLQRKCGYTAAHWAMQHTVKEWKKVGTSNNFKAEFSKMCPRGEKVLKDKWIDSLHLFAIEYAKGTGNHPRC
jgi:hypothetical protein